PFRLPARLGEYFRWLPSDALPQVPAKHREKEHAELRSEYDILLAGRPADEALEAAAKWFGQERGRAGLLRQGWSLLARRGGVEQFTDPGKQDSIHPAQGGIPDYLV
ncbi:MAG: hypothetical protein WBM24_20770, partial [Candidatus Sulfotelmatobacter sp.]